MNEAMLSYTIKAIDPQGFDEMFTVRGDDSADYFSKITALKKWLVANGYTPTGNGRRANSNGAQAANVPTCQYHGQMKESKYGGYFCPSKMGDGSYCKEKVGGQTSPPAPATQAMPQAQAVQHAAAQPTNGTPPPPPPMFDDAPPPDSYYSNEFN